MALSLRRYARPSHHDLDDLNCILRERSQKEREMSIAMETMRGDPLPEDVIIEILSRLPVKNLLQFKCVCKSWHAIITSPKLISKHLRNYYDKNDSDCLLAQYRITLAGEIASFELLVDETPTRALSHGLLDRMPFQSPYIYGPCDGIFYMYGHFYDFHALWNPAINELKTLPPIPNPPFSFSYGPVCNVYGFRLHPVTKDYEVIVMREFWREEGAWGDRYPLSVFVYTLSSDSWRYWGDLSRYYHLRNNLCYICVKGVFYWLGSYGACGDPEVIINFDLATNVCQEIQLPDYDKSIKSVSLAVYNDSIALLVVQKGSVLHVWTLDERCWTQKFVVGPLLGVQYPVGHWQNNTIILISDSDELLLCDPRTQEISGLGFEGSAMRCVGIFAYKESLVPVKNGHEEAETISDCRIICSPFLMDPDYVEALKLFD
ncbi:PREDICTED: putative F-box/LRR-repeat/kelch-repeat protein At1g11620 [Populus euphratica]|uniref:F-box/LRR-repeat/kelch-repeat protein At1g11620 n=1 Tax=Populus euphratica TaxID=75702 RepID=A0AAJ6V9X9_POPEU|nr:PREDICTED: putative F-box/LRR-repeat/kelch-repeat protein At1g11620 [Populus euphratica]